MDQTIPNDLSDLCGTYEGKYIRFVLTQDRKWSLETFTFSGNSLNKCAGNWTFNKKVIWCSYDDGSCRFVVHMQTGGLKIAVGEFLKKVS